MKTRARTAFTLTVTSCLAFFIGWIIPFWFGRWYPASRSKKQWGLFYEIQCRPGNCTNVGRILEKENVDFGEETSPIELEAISVMATLAFVMSLLGLVTVLVFHWHMCGRAYSYFLYVVGAAIIQIAAAVLGFITIILEAVSVGYFFRDLPFDSTIEFPWALLCYCLGEILLIASAVIYARICYKWKKYRRVYAKYRYPVDHKSGGTARPEPPPDYDTNRDGRYKSYDNESFVGYFRDDGHNSGDRYHRSSSRDRLPENDMLHVSGRELNMHRPYYTLPGRRSNNLLVSDSRVYSGASYFPYATVRQGQGHGGAARSKGGVWHTQDRWDDPAALGYNLRGSDVFM